MKKKLSLLLLEDNKTDAEFIQELLLDEGFELAVKRVDTELDFQTALNEWTPDVVISDYSLPSYNGLSALFTCKSIQPDTPFIFYSGTIGEEAAIEALKMGASDYVLKQRPKRLLPALKRALDDLERHRRQKAAEEQIKAQAQLLDLATDAIVVLDIHGAIVFWNDGAERLYGYTREEARGKLVSELIYKVPATACLEALSATLSKKEWHGEIEQVSKTRRNLTVGSRWTLVTNKAGEPERILTINTDVTETKLLQAQFLRAQRLESIGTLASGIAHDLNNILAPIYMASEILRTEKLPSESLAMVDVIQRSAERGADIVKQVLTFVRGKEGKRIPLMLGYLLKDVCKVATETFPKNIAISSVIDSNLLSVVGDSTQLHQVLMNLSINARDAMDAGGSLTILASNVVGADPDDAKVLIEVKDTGSGIPQEIIDKIFDPFFTTKESGKGTGLGLSTSLGIVKSHGGTLEVQSEPGVGTSFRIYLPAVVKKEGTQFHKKPLPVPRGNGELILVVDDEEQIRNVSRQALTQYGYEVLTAIDGDAAILQFSGHGDSIKMLITDMMMPGVDGSTLVKTVQAMKPGIKIITTSGLAEETAVPKGSFFLKKPSSAEDLLKMVHYILHGSVGDPPVAQ
jgi:PAS domain S-box-containing protein